MEEATYSHAQCCRAPKPLVVGQNLTLCINCPLAHCTLLHPADTIRKQSYMRFARQTSARIQPHGRTSNRACAGGIRRGLEGLSHPTPLGLEVKQLERVCKVGPGGGASDDNGCCIICPSSLENICVVKFFGMHGCMHNIQHIY